jgi:F420H(2)-dependent quinone reductase
MSGKPARKANAADEMVISFGARLLGRIDRWLYRKTRGNPKFSILARNTPSLLLTTIGRKSGEPRTTPVLYLGDGEHFVIVASKGGMPHHPRWYLNLQTNPDAEVVIGTERIPVRARTASAEEKARLWPRLVAMNPDFETYQARTDRNIPVLILSRR